MVEESYSQICAHPLVSIFSFCKDRVESIERSIKSVLNQTYRNIEFVIQDGASTDGTLEVLERYAEQDSRIKLISEKDNGPAEAFWRAIRRCGGEIVGSCLSDEELVPQAVENAVREFSKNPFVGAITGDAHVTDLSGKVTGQYIGAPFNLVDYLLGSYCPYFCASFFSNSALRHIGLYTEPWNLDCIEFELWCRLATDHEIKYVPGFVAKYAWHPGQLGNIPQHAREHVRGRVANIDKMYSSEGFFGDNALSRETIAKGILGHFARHFRAIGLRDYAQELEEECERRGSSIPMDQVATIRALLIGVWGRCGAVTPRVIRSSTKLQPLKDFVRTHFLSAGTSFIAKGFRLKSQTSAAARSEDVPAPVVGAGEKLILYKEAGDIYERRGQIDQALYYWRLAEGLNDPTLDSVFCSTILKSPTATQTDLLQYQMHWAERHVRTLQPATALKKLRRSGKITVAYHSSWWPADYIQYQILPFIRHHNHDRFHVIGYSPRPESSQTIKSFDKFVSMKNMATDVEFVEAVRRDEVDILVELNGFSPGHRFAAMSARCAPIQIHYANHHGTCGILNVDYVLADEVAAPTVDDPYFTEQIYRLPVSFFCFHYDETILPAVVEPPSRSSGRITFGCFGSGGKINPRLIELWGEILSRVPRSQIFLRNRELTHQSNRRFLIAQFARSGITPDRLILAGATDRAGILRSYGQVDITLDTWPYCGGNTIAESLHQGVPVVTLLGNRIASRYGASILQASGCSDLIAPDARSYIDIAVALASNDERLRHLRFNLRNMMRSEGFSDARAFAQKLEEAYENMLASASSFSRRTDSTPISEAAPL